MARVELLPSSRVGTGEPLLLLHGLGTTREDFHQIVPLLAAHFDTLSVDVPGQGAAPAVQGRPTVAALVGALEADLDARGLDRVHVLGNSLGARLALELARRGRARSVVAIAPSGLSIPPERSLQITGMALTSVAIRLLRPTMPSLAAHRCARVVLLSGLRARPWRASRQEAEALAGGYGSPEFWNLLLWAVGMDVPTGLEQIECPVLLAQGTADSIAAGQTARFLLQIPGARFQVLPCAGHAAQGDVPALVARLVQETAARGT